ncbi:hypothetical protein BC943DRAFT_359466 [Umbelopsis sp. AD052]|nr:hypothetical protein BC943DRAFT_359466 [Umbelopsis sp. AD052]
MSNWNFQHFDTQSDFGVVDENGVTHRVRKKPGRKANPAASAQRKAQNRAAQRAFRERKQREKKETDAHMRQTTCEMTQLRRLVKELQFENKQLKAMVIAYILTCFELNSSHPRIHAMSTNDKARPPPGSNMPALLNVFIDENCHILDLERAALNLLDVDSPYPECTAPSRSLKHEKKLHGLFDDTLIIDESCTTGQSTTPQPSDAQFATDIPVLPQFDHLSTSTSVSSPDTDMTFSSAGFDTIPPLPKTFTGSDVNETMSILQKALFAPPYVSTKENTPSPGVQRFYQSTQAPNGHTENFVMLESNRQIVQEQWNNVMGGDQDKFIDEASSQWDTNAAAFGQWDNPEYMYPPMHPIQAIQLLRLQMKVGNILGADKDILNPTDLQQAIVHDRRIDYIPGPGMRDRMILFRDHFDADECFNLLATKSIFLGGEVTNPSNWALPERFYDKYWFLCANQDLQNAEKVECLSEYRQRIFRRVKEKRAQQQQQSDVYIDVEDVLSSRNLSNLGIREYMSCI